MHWIYAHLIGDYLIQTDWMANGGAAYFELGKSPYLSELYLQAEASRTTTVYDGLTTTTVIDEVTIISGRESKTLLESIKSVGIALIGWLAGKGKVTP